MWIRAIIAFAVVILVITEAGAQDGADNRCGRRVCRQNECCTERRFYGRTIRMCRRIPRENGLCGGNNFCPCPEGLECKPTYTGIFFRINQCKKNWLFHDYNFHIYGKYLDCDINSDRKYVD